jgi:hypothetical protein
LIFENINKYIGQLDLQRRHNIVNRKCIELEKENKRLVEENEKNKRRINSQNIFRQQRDYRKSTLDAFYRRLDQQTVSFMNSIDGSRAQDIVKGWMRSPESAPKFFVEWLEREKAGFLYNVLDDPSKWDYNLKNRILESCKQGGLLEYKSAQ